MFNRIVLNPEADSSFVDFVVEEKVRLHYQVILDDTSASSEQKVKAIDVLIRAHQDIQRSQLYFSWKSEKENVDKAARETFSKSIEKKLIKMRESLAEVFGLPLYTEFQKVECLHAIEKSVADINRNRLERPKPSPEEVETITQVIASKWIDKKGNLIGVDAQKASIKEINDALIGKVNPEILSAWSEHVERSNFGLWVTVPVSMIPGHGSSRRRP